MRFLKASDQYKIMYKTRKEAAKELRKEPRIARVIVRNNDMVIYTRPLMPTNTDKRIALAPIGRYRLRIYGGKRPDITITRIGGDFYGKRSGTKV